MRGFRKKTFFFIYFFIVSLIVFSKTEIQNFKVWETSNNNSYRITIDFSSEPQYKFLKSGNQYLKVLNFKNAIYRQNSNTVRIKDGNIDYFRLVQFDSENVRLVGMFKHDFIHKTYIIRNNTEYSYRLVIDYKKEIHDNQKISNFPTVVIDPGHGGRDPGAVGRNGTKEKDVVFDVAKNLEKLLWETGRVNPVLTREEDAYVGLKDRVQLTENKGAMLFISLHNNAEPTRRARGYRVYILNDSGKVDKATEMLAVRENEAFDVFDNTENKVNDLNVLEILYDLKLNQSISESSRFATSVLDKFRRDFKQVDTQVRRAPFAVLKLAGIPSVLIECGFLSNTTDERMLNNKFYRERIAESISEAVLEYLGQKNMLAREIENIILPDYYTIKPGDTLSTIANRFRIDIENLKEINNIENPSQIYAGSKIRIN
ncbi:MAG: N-acetylmuramoyl-L-alanine amidase [Candidatus Muiribacteriota bacterium]